MNHKARIAIAALSLSAIGFVSIMESEGFTHKAIILVKGDQLTIGLGSIIYPRWFLYLVLAHRLTVYAPRFLRTFGRPHALALHFARHGLLVGGFAPSGVRPCWAHVE